MTFKDFRHKVCERYEDEITMFEKSEVVFRAYARKNFIFESSPSSTVIKKYWNGKFVGQM